MRRAKIQPTTDLYIEWYRDFHEFIDNYWIKKTSLPKWRRNGRALMIYTKVVDKRKEEGRRWRRIFVDSYEVLRYLHIVWAIDMYKLDRQGPRRYLKDDKIIILSKLSPDCKEKIFDAITPEVLSIVEKYWDKKDKKLARGLE